MHDYIYYNIICSFIINVSRNYLVKKYTYCSFILEKKRKQKKKTKTLTIFISIFKIFSNFFKMSFFSVNFQKIWNLHSFFVACEEMRLDMCTPEIFVLFINQNNLFTLMQNTWIFLRCANPKQYSVFTWVPDWTGSPWL